MTSVTVVGLGYVGFPLALLAAEKGHRVYGYDINEEHIKTLQQGISPFADPALQEKLSQTTSLTFGHDPIKIRDADIVIVCVPTPVDKDHKPNLNPLRKACETVASYLRKGQLIAIESTIFPGTMEEIILPIMQSSNLTVGDDYWLVHCPERIDPGNPNYSISTINRVLGGITPRCGKKGKDFYDTLIDAEVQMLSSIKAAETTKVVENTFRDVNIALVNELAQAFDSMGIDVLEVIKGASTKPFAFMPHYPGCGVGGHCIPVDPYYLIEKSREKGFNPKFLAMARKINEGMPAYTVKKVVEGLLEAGKTLQTASIVLLGLAYKKEIDDIRESPSLVIADALVNRGAQFEIYDPYVLDKSTVTSLPAALHGKDCVIIATNHAEFANLTAQELQDAGVKVVVDGRNCLNKQDIIDSGIVYKGIGR